MARRRSGGLTWRPGTNDMMVVIVDDDPDDLDVYCDLFVAIDPEIAVKTFLLAREALAYLRQLQRVPDLLILDLNMPQMGGLEFLGYIRKDTDLMGINVVVITT